MKTMTTNLEPWKTVKANLDPWKSNLKAWKTMNVQFIFLLQCLKKEIATAKELDLRPLGKVIIFRDRQTDRQTEPSYYI